MDSQEPATIPHNTNGTNDSDTIITISCKSPVQTFTLQTTTQETIGDIKRKYAKEYDFINDTKQETDPDFFMIFFNGKLQTNDTPISTHMHMQRLLVDKIIFDPDTDQHKNKVENIHEYQNFSTFHTYWHIDSRSEER